MKSNFLIFFSFMVSFGVMSKIPQALDPKSIIFIWLKTLQKSVTSDNEITKFNSN